MSTDEINEQLEEVSDLMYAWSSNYFKGEPKKMKDSDISIITSQDSKYQKAAKDLYPQLNKEIISLVNLMKNHLKNEEKA